jgi:nucleoside-diphosphate-sugar epimerase
MRILVTGGGGFLGSAIIIRLLEEGHLVRSFQRSPAPQLEKAGAQVMQGDLLDGRRLAEAADGCEAVIHTAALAGVWGSRKRFEAVNITGTRQVLAACKAVGARFLIHTSTPSVVFSGEDFRGADESLPLGRNWLCDYARTKAEAEREALAANHPHGLKVIALRPHLIFGPGDPHLLPRVIERARQSRLRIVGSGENKVDVTYIDNAAQAHLDALDALSSGNHPGGRAYFISNGEPVKLWPWINGILASLEITPVRRKIPAPAAKVAGGLLEIIWSALRLRGEPPMTRFVATELAKDHWFDISAARRDLGYRPENHKMAEALDKTISWLQKREAKTTS